MPNKRPTEAESVTVISAFILETSNVTRTSKDFSVYHKAAADNQPWMM